jgi:uncharacterized protein
MKIEDFLARVKKCAEPQSDINGVLLAGSYARGSARADTDIDLVILTTNPHRYLESISFVSRFGSTMK